MGLSQCPKYSTDRKLWPKLTLPRKGSYKKQNIMQSPIVRFEAVIVRSESTLHSLHRIKQSPCNALLRLKPPIVSPADRYGRAAGNPHPVRWWEEPQLH